MEVERPTPTFINNSGEMGLPGFRQMAFLVTEPRLLMAQ